MKPSELVESLIKNGATLEGNSGIKLFYDDLKILYGGGFVVGRYQSRPKGFAKHYDGDDFQEALRVFAEAESEDEHEPTE